MIIYLRWLFFRGFSIYPFVFIRNDAPLKTLNHELIHGRQQRELFVVFAFIFYWAEFLLKLMYYRNIVKAYYAISFEREAFLFEEIPNYFSLRPKYFWLTLVFMNVPLIRYDSVDAIFELLMNAEKGVIFQYEDDYSQLVDSIDAYRALNYPAKDLGITQILPGTNMYTIYGPNAFIVVNNTDV